MPLQAQIGEDPRNTLLAYCVRYKQDVHQLVALIAGSVAGVACIVAVIILTTVCYVRHKRNNYPEQRRSQTDSISQQYDDDIETESSFSDYVRRSDYHQSVDYPLRLVRPPSIFPVDEPTPTTYWDHQRISGHNTPSLYPADLDTNF